jgi:hypothetical protein
MPTFAGLWSARSATAKAGGNGNGGAPGTVEMKVSDLLLAL